jgi:hypothetical protein
MFKWLRRRRETQQFAAISNACDFLGADVDAMECFRDKPEEFGKYVGYAYEHISEIREAIGRL